MVLNIFLRKTKDFILKFFRGPIKKFLIYENQIILYLMAIVVGIFGGLGAVAFRAMLYAVTKFFRGDVVDFFSKTFGFYSIALVPAVGGLIVGVMTFYLGKETSGHGVPEVLEAISLHGGRMRARVPILKSIVASITLGSGGSAGREGPIAQIGAGIGSFFSRILTLNREQTRTLVNCGLAAGIAGTFNAPIGASLFAMEVIYKKPKKESLMPIIVSAVMGAAIAREFFGSFVTFKVPDVVIERLLPSLPFFLLLGIIVGFASYFWVRGFYVIEDLFTHMDIPFPAKVGLGGFFVGLIGLFVPQVLGVGYDTVSLVLAGKIAFFTLVVLFLTKFLVTSFTLGSGGSGGIFSPTLFMGSTFGAGVGLFFNHFMPHLVSQPYIFALVGMGAFITGTLKAPLTGIIMISEIGENYTLLIPLMAACALSYVLSAILIPEDDIYTLKLKRRGIKLKEEPFDILRTISVGEVMQKKPVTISVGTPRKVMRERLKLGYSFYPVLENNLLIGYITRDDLKRVLRKKGIDIKKFVRVDQAIIYPDRTVRHALDMITKTQKHVLFVVERLNEQNLLGIFTKGDLINAYQKAIPSES